MALYSSIERTEDGYAVRLAERTVEIRDEASYLEYFAEKKPLRPFLADGDVWGEDLTQYEGFYEAVAANIEKIKNGACLL